MYRLDFAKKKKVRKSINQNTCTVLIDTYAPRWTRAEGDDDYDS